MPVNIPFDNSYANLPDRFYARVGTTPVRAPKLLALNDKLAASLGLNPDELRAPDGVAVLSGSAKPEGADLIAQAYAEHQFGGWSPQLGDGRAMMLGEVVDRNGLRQDIQLKGSGRTPFSRGGDGKAWLGPVLREYVISEAMHALGIPTTRALAVIATGEDVMRETALPGAVLTRVSTSHIRVGTFQYFAARNDTEALEILVKYTIERHYPDAENAFDLFQSVITAQAKLIAKWMGVGFIHGVMNTDNTHIGGITIDYGPCAFMDGYNPAQVYSSIDRAGRYAYNQQPRIIIWNLAQLATSLLPLFDADESTAIAMATKVLNGFEDIYQQEWLSVFGRKFGLVDATVKDAPMMQAFLSLLEQDNADFSNSFRALAEGNVSHQVFTSSHYSDWINQWTSRIEYMPDARLVMQSASPAIIPRNHQIEAMIDAAVTGDMAPFERMNTALQTPFANKAEHTDLRQPPTTAQQVHQTFCGT